MTAKLDASAIIYLSKAGLLDVATRVFNEIVITAGVYDEAVVRGREAGHPDAMIIEKAVQDRLVQVISLDDTGHKHFQEARFPDRLGYGEQETIIEALGQGCLAVLDDHRARSAAVVLGVSPCRTETMLMEAEEPILNGEEDYERLRRYRKTLHLPSQGSTKHKVRTVVPSAGSDMNVSRRSLAAQQSRS